jgi:hypothetical protein
MRRLGLLPFVVACGRVGFDAVPDAGTICAISLSNGLVGHWTFDEGSGLTASDSAGGHAGMLLGGATWTTGYIGGALAFDGVDDRVDISGDVVYATQAMPFTFAAWFDLTDYSTTTPDIMQIRSDTPSPWHVLMSSMPSFFGISVGSGDGVWIPIRTGCSRRRARGTTSSSPTTARAQGRSRATRSCSTGRSSR